MGLLSNRFKIISALLFIGTIMTATLFFSGCGYFESKTIQSKPKYITDNLQLLRKGGCHPKWSHKNNLIAFDEMVNRNLEIFTMRPDGSDVKCLTCNKPGVPTGHKGQPFWHPSGKYIVFSAENDEYERWNRRDMTVMPAISGRNNDVWIMTSDGKKFWRITNTPENGGVIRPSFSPDGKTLYWNEEWSLEKYPGRGSLWSLEDQPLGEKWGLWRIKLADISFDKTGVPIVSNVRTVNINKLYPGKVLLEGQGIQPDNEHLIFSAADINETKGYVRWGFPPKDIYGYAHWGELYVTDLEGGSLVRLTHTPYNHDENPEFSPDFERIVWSRAKGAVGDRVEFYIMNADSSNIKQLTHFTEPGYPEYKGRIGACGEVDWSPDGQQIIFSKYIGLELKYPYVKSNIYLLAIKVKSEN